jgi:hypothetical protein
MCRLLLFPFFFLAMIASPARAQEKVDSTDFPPGFRPFVHLIGEAEVVAAEDGPNWRAVDIKDYDESKNKYMELEALVLKVWPQVMIITTMLDTMRPAFSEGIGAVPDSTLQAQRDSIAVGKAERKAEKKAEKKARKLGVPTEDENPDVADAAGDKGQDDQDPSGSGISIERGNTESEPSIDTISVSNDPCIIALQEQQGYSVLDSLDAEGMQLMVSDTTVQEDFGFKEGFLMVHLLDRQNPGMLAFADDYAKAVKLPFWSTIKMFSRLSGYRLNKSYDPDRYDGRLEHIIRKHGLDLQPSPCE